MADAAARLRALLPRGSRLDEASFRLRHRSIAIVLGLHVPLIAIIGVLEAVTVQGLLLVLLPLALLVLLGFAPLGRLPRMLAVTVGLCLASVGLVHLTGNVLEASFHFFFALALISLYQDWRPYLAALGGVLLHHGLVGLALMGMVPSTVAAAVGPAAAQQPLRLGLVHLLAVVAVAVTYLVFWKVVERGEARAQELWRRLYEGERALVEQLQAAESAKTELLAVVSHEFRTPLTSIIGFSHTLMARVDQLDPATVRLCVRNIDQQSRRLARLVHNVLAASGDVATDPGAVTDLVVKARDVARDIGDAYDEDAPEIVVDAPPSLRAAIDADAAERVLLNLLDNAVKFSILGNDVDLRLSSEGGAAVVTISNVASPIAAAQLERIFQPFVQEDSSDNRAVGGIGLGLHVVRRLLDAYEGGISVAHRDERVIFVATVPLATPAAPPGITLQAGGAAREQAGKR
jgi:signal transduction histidine kinase